MDILLWIVFGLVVGLVARLIMPGPDPGGIVLTIVLGIVGACKNCGGSRSGGTALRLLRHA